MSNTQMKESLMTNFIEKNKIALMVLIAIIALAGLAMVFSGGGGTASGNGVVKTESKVESNVGDQTVAENAISIKGMNIGGGVGHLGNNNQVTQSNTVDESATKTDDNSKTEDNSVDEGNE